MRIAYGIHGYGRGHATRARSVLAELDGLCDLQVFAGGDAYDMLRRDFQVHRVPVLRYAHGARGRVSLPRTVRDNLPRLWDLGAGCTQYQQVRDSLREIDPRAVIIDAEPWTHRAAGELGLRRINFDHFGLMVHCELDLPLRDRALGALDRFIYRRLLGACDHALVSSFYRPPARSSSVAVIPPLLRPEVRQLRATQAAHVLVYFNRADVHFTTRLRREFGALPVPVRLYGTSYAGRSGSVEFRPTCSRGFLEDLASCRAVISTAGNQLVGEAGYLGKPMLVIPEDTVEQRLNARHLERLGLGEQATFEELDRERVMTFLARSSFYAARASRHASDGTGAALLHLDRWLGGALGRAAHRLAGLRTRETSFGSVTRTNRPASVGRISHV